MRKFLVLTVAAALLVALAAPAFASGAARMPGAQATLAGRMLTDFGWNNNSAERTTSGNDVGSIFINMPGHSFLRARWRTKDAKSGARIELGLAALQPSATVSLRYAYGWTKFGALRILAGQTDNWFGSLAYHPRQYVGLNQNAHLLLFGWGLLWPHRVTQLQFTYQAKGWGIQFALEDPRVKTNVLGTGGDVKFTLPRLSLTAMFKAGGFMTHPGISWVLHQYETNGADPDDYTTWAFVLPMMFKAGAFTVKFQFHFGANYATEYPFYPAAYTSPAVDGTNVEDSKNWGGYIAFEYKFGKAMVTAGFGYEKFENDTWVGDDNTRMAFFVAVPYQVNKYFGIHPEFSWFDYGDDPTVDGSPDLGTEWLLGIQFRFIF